MQAEKGWWQSVRARLPGAAPTPQQASDPAVQSREAAIQRLLEQREALGMAVAEGQQAVAEGRAELKSMMTRGVERSQLQGKLMLVKQKEKALQNAQAFLNNVLVMLEALEGVRGGGRRRGERHRRTRRRRAQRHTRRRR